MVTSYGVGQYAASEAHVLYTKRDYRPDASAVPLVYFHSATATALQPLRRQGMAANVDAVIALMVERLVHQGHPAISFDMAGASSWNNAAARARATDALTFIGAQLGCRIDRCLVMGVSMGSLTALEWARENQAKVAAVGLALPIPDFVRIHTSGPAPIPANIETAWGGLAAWQAGVDAVDPAQHTTDFTVPIQLHYSADDTTALPADSQAFDAAVASATAIQFTGAGGHTLGGTFDSRGLTDFLHSNA